MRILGISCHYHDAAAALLVDGRIVAAAQEERFTRKKHDARFPERAVEACLAQADLKAADLDAVVYYDKPFLKFERLLETHIAYAPRGLKAFLLAMPVWIKRKLWVEDEISEKLEGFKGKILFAQHHESHAASAFYPSPFEEAAVLTVDGVGEWATTTIAHGRGRELTLLKELRFPHSLGLLYSAVTYYLGFKVNSGEYKVMGLAPYGRPIYAEMMFEKLMDLKADGSFRLKMEAFDFPVGLRMTNRVFDDLFGGPPRTPESELTQREMDIAASLQHVTEEIMMRLARHAKEVTGARNLCLAGGVALNCVANGKILKSGLFERVWIQPASGDAGGALGAALAAWHVAFEKPRAALADDDLQRGSYLGPAYAPERIRAWLKEKGIPYQELSEAEAPTAVARLLADGKVVGHFSGPMEFGPRALGARSILADPRNPEMQSKLNLKIKFRESFRPFAPSVLRERVGEWFDMKVESPYMLLTADVAIARRLAVPESASKGLWGIDWLKVPKSTIPAVTHVDASARIQTVDKRHHPAYYAMIEAFERLTGCPVVVNTSFNVRGEPIVESPEDAYRCFMRTDMDNLLLERFLLRKEGQPKFEDGDWRKEYELD